MNREYTVKIHKVYGTDFHSVSVYSELLGCEIKFISTPENLEDNIALHLEGLRDQEEQNIDDEINFLKPVEKNPWE